MISKLQAFYKSRRWEEFVKRLRLERSTADGLLLCEHCRKPIFKAYDCIAHHVQELTPENVDDVQISLNPDNVVLVHFKCHNEIHQRFGYKRRLMQSVYIVYGSPCAGKSTWVDSVAESSDIVLDVDRLWNAIRAGRCGNYDKPAEIKSNVFGLRDTLLDMIRVRRGKWQNAYIIGGYPLQGERERLADTMNANKIIFIDTPKDVCLKRAKLRDIDYSPFIEEWFSRYTPHS